MTRYNRYNAVLGVYNFYRWNLPLFTVFTVTLCPVFIEDKCYILSGILSVIRCIMLLYKMAADMSL